MDALVGGVALGLLYVGAVCVRGARWIAWWHGEGEAHQYQFYRCRGCRRILGHFHIQTGGCPCKEEIKISPARLTRMEKLKALFLPWMVTSSLVRRAALARRAVVEAKQHARQV